jgi:hypothetical protein
MMNPMMTHDGMMWGMGIGHQVFSDFIDYGLAEARKTNFDVQLLSGLREYVESFLQYCEGTAAARTTAAAREAHRREYPSGRSMSASAGLMPGSSL